MDKNIYNMKAEKIQKQAKLGDYETAAKICDTIDWTQVDNVRMLVLVSSVYEHVGNYDAAIDILLMAYEEAPVGRRFLYKLTELAIAGGNIREAEDYYRRYLKEAPDDNNRYLLRYLLAEAKGETLDKRITILEAYKKLEFEEEWAFRLAMLYRKAGRPTECVALCDEIILWFGVGPYVDKAMELKEQYEPLTERQREYRDNKAYYEENLNRIAREMGDGQDSDGLKAPVAEAPNTVSYAGEAEANGEEEELPTVAISDESNGLYISEFDEAAFVAEEETAATEIPDIMGTTREVVDDSNISGARVFHRVEGDENVTFEQSLGAVVQNLLREEQEPVLEAEQQGENISVQNEVHEDRAAELAEEIFREELPNEVTKEVPSEELPAKEEALPVIEAEQLELVWEDLDDDTPEQPKELIFLGSPSSAEGINMAVDALRKAYESEGGQISRVAKISGGKLNIKGLINSLPNLEGKDLIIDNANSLDDKVLYEIEKVRTELVPEKRFVLVDRPAGIYRLKERIDNLGKSHEEDELPKILLSDDSLSTNKTEPVQASARQEHPEVKVRARNKDAVRTEEAVSEKAEVTAMKAVPKKDPEIKKSVKPSDPVLPEGRLDENMELTEEQFVSYVKRYAAEIDCVIEEVAVLAVYKVIEEIREDGDRLTVGIAEDVVEDAADEAERKTIRNIFGSRYDKEGRLILKERHF